MPARAIARPSGRCHPARRARRTQVLRRKQPARADAGRGTQAEAIALPDDPLEPYLLTKENGPFMVMAKVFRGPDAEKMALALCMELRQDFGLPAYILRTKDFPMKSYIRGTPPRPPA